MSIDLIRKRNEVQDRVKAMLGNDIICSRCGATYYTMNDVCDAPLNDRCPGFVRWDEVQVPIEREVFGL
jgi:hypothetical protein